MRNSVSVIIPVYNAAKYLRQAVESAREQPETGEIILVEDNSPDDSLLVCQELSNKYENVHLFQHPNGINRGAGPSRNLGIEKSTLPFIAFLDADDIFLPGRFSVPREIFEQNPKCDGVYEAVGLFFEDKVGEERWLASNMAQVRLTSLQRNVDPADLFRVLIKGGSGHIHLNGLIIKRSILLKSGLMDESIADTLHEDVDFIMRLAAVGVIMPGRINEASSMRRVHSENRVSAPRPVEKIYWDRMRLRVATYRWCKQNRLVVQRKLVFKRLMVDCVQGRPIKNISTSRSKNIRECKNLLSLLFDYPEVLIEGAYWSETIRAIWAVIKIDWFSSKKK